MRGQLQDPIAQDATILSLPLRQGGLGLHSVFDTAEHARAASIQASDSTLDSFLSTDRMKDAVIKTQRDRCRETLDLQRKQLAANLHGPELLQFADTAGRWICRRLHISFYRETPVEHLQICVCRFSFLCGGAATKMEICIFKSADALQVSPCSKESATVCKTLCQRCDNHSKLSRQWLYAIPYKTYSKLSNQAVATGLHYRTLIPGHLGTCKHCGQRNILGHDEVCTKKHQLKTYRHEQVKAAIQYHVSTITETEVQVEKHILDGPRTELRPDLRIVGPGSYQQHFSEYDVSVISMFAANSASHHRAPPGAAPQLHLNAAQDVLLRILDYWAGIKIAKYRGHTRGAFHPVLISLGGSLSSDTQDLFRFWRDKLGEGRYKSLLQDISISLLRAKARFFAL